MRRVRTVLFLALTATAGPASAADLPGFAPSRGLPYGRDLGPAPRDPGPPLLDFEGRPRRFPYGGGCATGMRADGAPATITNAPWDPTYVGSAYGLNKPSRDGFVPPLGSDDPSDRPLRRCG